MLVNNAFNTRKALETTGQKFVLFLGFSVFIGWACKYFSLEDYLIDLRLLSIMASGVGVFLAFRINSGYGRWWEARKIWGEMVNASRSFGMSVTSLITENYSIASPEEKELQRKLVYNHIGYINALRMNLRKNSEEIWENELWTRKINGKSIINPDDISYLKAVANKPTQLLQIQSDLLSIFFDGKNDKEYRYIELMSQLKYFYDIQGKSERIKNTVFPWGYAFYTKILVWLLAFMIPFTFISSFDIQTIVMTAIISTVFITIEQVGRNLDNPFENSFNDTPMSGLCRTIEIDLLEQLGEPRTEAITPVKGVLF